MKLSKRGEYAIRALIALGVSYKMGKDLISLAELAENERIPENFLQIILVDLRVLGFVKTTRGKLGGYSLGKSPEEIVVGRVVRDIEGPLAPVRCVSKTAYEKCSCPDETACGLRFLMGNVRDSIADILDHTTIADLVKVASKRSSCQAHARGMREKIRE